MTLPLGQFGMSGGVLRANSSWLNSSVTDPTTHSERIISGDQRFSGSLEPSNDVPTLNATWSATLTGASRSTIFLIDEVEAQRYEPQLDFLWRQTPAPGVTIEIEMENITGREGVRRRDIYGGLRDQRPVSSVEVLRIDAPRALHLRLRRTW